jgi:hypothetical protein
MMPACTGPTGIWWRLAFGGKEGVGGRLRRRGRGRAPERRAQRPAPVVEPRPRVGQAFRDEAEQVARGALEADRARPRLGERGEAAVRARERRDGVLAGRLVAQRDMDRAGVAPQAEQRPIGVAEPVDQGAPAGRIEDDARPRRMRRHARAAGEEREERRGRLGHRHAPVPARRRG